MSTPKIAASSAEPRPSARPNGVAWSSTWIESAAATTTSAPIASSAGATRRRNTIGSISAVKNVIVDSEITAVAMPATLIAP